MKLLLGGDNRESTTSGLNGDPPHPDVYNHTRNMKRVFRKKCHSSTEQCSQGFLSDCPLYQTASCCRCLKISLGVITHLFVVDSVSDVDAGSEGYLLDGRVQVDEVALDALLRRVEVQPLQQGGLPAPGHAHDDAHHGLLLCAGLPLPASGGGTAAAAPRAFEKEKGGGVDVQSEQEGK